MTFKDMIKMFDDNWLISVDWPKLAKTNYKLAIILIKKKKKEKEKEEEEDKGKESKKY